MCAGVTPPHSGANWILHVGRNLTDAFSGFLRGKRFLLMDRDGAFHAAFRGLLESAGVQPVRLPARAPIATRTSSDFTAGSKREVADRMIFLGEDHLRRATADYLEYYHRERNHQGLAGRLINPGAETGSSSGKVCRPQRLGGTLNYYYRDAT